MTVYHRYTVTATREILCLYKCEKCGEFNLTKVQIRGQGQYNDRNTGFRRSTIQEHMEERNRNASSNAEDSLDDTLERLESNLSARTLARAGIRCKCSKCGQEPWWTMRTANILNTVARPLTGLGIILLFALSGNQSPLKFAALAAAMLCWIMYFAYLGYAENKLKKGILPLFAGSIEKMREKKARNSTYKDVTI